MTGISHSLAETAETAEIAEAAEESATSRVVASTIQKSVSIATLPPIVVRIIGICDDPKATFDDLQKAIDPVLAMRILKIINSAFYGMSGKISSIKHAVLLLGIKAVKNVAISASLVKLVRGGLVSSSFDANKLWAHSVAVATCSRLLAQQTNMFSPDEAFLAGLIHDLGIVVEMQVSRADFINVIKALDEDETLTFRRAEEEVLGASHEELGVGLCKAWNFPSSIQLAAGYHHRPWELPEPVRQLPTVVHVADVLAARLGLGYARTVETDSIDSQLLAQMNLTDEDLKTIADKLPEAMQESQRLVSDDR